MSPLAHEIYRQLVRHLRHGKPSITYAELAVLVSKRHPVHHRSSSFHKALGEVTAACRSAKLPCLPAIVWQASGNCPSLGYYKAAHPRARTDDARLAAWEREHTAVLRGADSFPAALPG